ncbi:dihydrodipicolinate synthase family protein [Streptomyces albus subsp. chlorinus]|uniref:dihydrodipicolinate synthase family protein n=1 Tax=Streptomyces albus TaxID=1888 RepID=UPI00156D7B59|nr:dihydrodipicolinate synthase family protein [Streptomyces albus]NSC24890.1 dihydrodipicolinate synthase family protein [Streptomyces albus subsp. chlorinus]
MNDHPAPGTASGTAFGRAVSGGVLPPLCAPLTEDGELDAASLERLCGFLLEAGVDGLFVNGSTGELAYHTDAFKLDALRVVRHVAGGSVPVLAGAVDMTTHRVIAQARAAQEAGADGVVATVPFYSPTHPGEMADHFRAVRAAVDLPLWAYDIPGNVQRKLPAAVAAELADDGVLAGLKDSSGDLEELRTLLDLTAAGGARERGFTVLTGSETMADTALALGADGIVPGLGNIDPHGYLALHRAARRGDLPAAAREQARLRRLYALTRVGDPARVGAYSSGIGAFKEALRRRGVIATATTPLPMRPLTDEERAEVGRHLAEAGLGPYRAA